MIMPAYSIDLNEPRILRICTKCGWKQMTRKPKNKTFICSKCRKVVI